MAGIKATKQDARVLKWQLVIRLRGWQVRHSQSRQAEGCPILEEHKHLPRNSQLTSVFISMVI
jgi:hypothetical protein